MPDKRPNDAQLRFNARASNSKRHRNSHAKTYRPKNRCLPDSPEIFLNPRNPLTMEHGQYFPGHSCSFARYLWSLSYEDSELRINFTLPPPSFPQPRHHLAHPPLGTAMYQEQWKWLSATLNPGKASLIRHQRQNQRHRQCCNSRVNSPPCARNTPAYYWCLSETINIFS